MDEVITLLEAVAGILDAGARKSREWTFNLARQQDAEVLEAMADEARNQVRSLERRHS